MGSEKDVPRAARTPRGVLARTLALAYLLVIAYASLQPFSGWWVPPQEIRMFLSAPWPRYITLDDVLINIAVYVPLGFLLARAFIRRYRAARAALIAAGLTLVTSVAMESVQMFMPARIASNVDVLANALGGLIGALAAPIFAPGGRLGVRLTRMRQQWFVYGVSADVGLVLVCIWLATQLQPNAQLFGMGNLRDTFDLPVWIIHTPQLLVVAEAAVAAVNLLGVGLLVVALTRETMPRGAAAAAVLLAGFAAKSLAAVTFVRAASPIAWLTPGVLVGVLVGAVALFGFMGVPRRTQWLAAGLSFVAGVLIINIGPENPYQSVPPQLLAGPTHLLSFSGIVRAFSELWPFLAVVYVATLLRETPAIESGTTPLPRPF